MKLNIYDKLYPDSAPACIYGTPKMLKFSCSDSFPKLCLMVSSIGTFNYNLACFLCDPSPVVPNDYSHKDTFSFVSNIPLQETVGLVINLIFNHNPNQSITKKELNFSSFLLYDRVILLLTLSFIIKSME